MAVEAAKVLVERAGSTAIVTLNHPQRRNALSLALMRELQSTFEQFRNDRAVRTIVLAAHGPAFSAGHDLREVHDAQVDDLETIFSQCVSLMETLHALPQPVIAEVSGVATAAGCQLVAACDLALASPDATFATPGVKIGLFCSTPMVPIARAIGPKRAMQLLLTGEPIDAHTALAWGLINDVVAREQLRERTLALCEHIATASGAVIGIGKAAFYRQAGLDERDAYRAMTDVMVQNAQHADAREGMSAFIGKRPPRWTDATSSEV